MVIPGRTIWLSNNLIWGGQAYQNNLPPTMIILMKHAKMSIFRYITNLNIGKCPGLNLSCVVPYYSHCNMLRANCLQSLCSACVQRTHVFTSTHTHTHTHTHTYWHPSSILTSQSTHTAILNLLPQWKCITAVLNQHCSELFSAHTHTASRSKSFRFSFSQQPSWRNLVLNLVRIRLSRGDFEWCEGGSALFWPS